MPAPVIAAIIGAGAAVGTTVYSAKKQDQARDATTSAANYAADLQAKQNADALAFSKAQAENAFQNNEAARHGNYDQWAAAQRRLGALGDLIGAPTREIPAYVPGVDPGFTGSGATNPAAPSGSSSMPNVNVGGGDIGQQISAYFKARGVADSETPYWVQKWSEFGQNDPAYFNQRLSQADIFRGGSPAPTSIASSYKVPPVNAYLGTPYASTPVTPALPNPYTIAPVSAYLG